MGFYDFVTKPAIVKNESLKLKTNRFLNAAGVWRTMGMGRSSQPLCS